MAHAQYLILLGLCLLVTLPLELVLGVRVYRSPRRLLCTLVPVAVVFIAWDLLGIARGHWNYDPASISGILLGPLPLEELLFFLVIPVCGLLTYEAVGRVGELLRGRGRLRLSWPDGLTRDGEEPDA